MSRNFKATGRLMFNLFLFQLLCTSGVKAEGTSLDETRHLLQRTGFAERPSDVLAASKLSYESLVSNILQNDNPVSVVPKPDWMRQSLRARPDLKNATAQQRRKKNKEIGKLERQRLHELQYWWLSSLITTPNPLKAKMTLFWQNHFTSSQRKVRHAQLITNQLDLLIQDSTGNFGVMLRNLITDPAMLIYLDNRSNRKNNPNENLARELLELFTLGEGNYTESDIKNAARALSGYTVNKQFESIFRRRQHDNGTKTILNSTANHDANSLVDLLLAQPATARHIVTKLWHYFISQTPPAASIEELAVLFRQSNYELKPLLQEMFRSEAFRSAVNRSTLIRSPADFIASTLRVAGIHEIDKQMLLRASRDMGQTLFTPPNVKGWQENEFWINGQTLLARNSFVTRIARNPGKAMSNGMNSMGGSMQENPNSMSTATDASARTKKKKPRQRRGGTSMAHLIDAPSEISDAQVRAALIGTAIPIQKGTSRLNSRIGQLLLEPAWNLY